MSRHVDALLAGGLAIVPTDTVYGIGAAAPLAGACARLYTCKDRPSNQPTAIVVGSVDRLLARVLPELDGPAAQACRDVLPGPVTLVLPNPARRFGHLCGSTPDRIGVRVPRLEAGVASLADTVGGLALTSANRRGEEPARRLADVPRELRDACAVVIDGGELPGVPSTVIDLTGGEPRVLRQGAGLPPE